MSTTSTTKFSTRITTTSTTSHTSATSTTSNHRVKERVVAVVLAKPKIRLITLVEEIRRELGEELRWEELRWEELVEAVVEELVEEGVLELESWPWGLAAGF